MLLPIILLLAGMFLLIKFSSITIERAVRLSKLTGVGEATIGFVLIAVSTSLPELMIAIISSSEGEGLLSFGNLIGSSVSDLTMVFGITAFIGFTLKRKGLVETDQALLFTAVSVISLLILGAAVPAFGLFLLIIFYVFSKTVMKEDMTDSNGRTNELPTIQLVKGVLAVVVSVVIVVIGAKLATDSAVSIANTIGVAETIIGATILGFGTTMPELSVNIAALRRGNVALAVGDSVGSIVTNMTLILGVLSILNPFVLTSLQTNLLLLMLGVMMVFSFLASRMRFGKKEGMVLLVTYAVYLGIVAWMGA